MRWLDSINNSMEMNLSQLWEIVKDRGAWCATVRGVSVESQRAGHDLVTQQQQKQLDFGQGWGYCFTFCRYPNQNLCFNMSPQGGSNGPRRFVVLLLQLLSRFSRVRLCGTPQTAAHWAPPSLGFSRQEYWSGVPLPSPRFVVHSITNDCKVSSQG